jgi:hypothetical protein
MLPVLVPAQIDTQISQQLDEALAANDEAAFAEVIAALWTWAFQLACAAIADTDAAFSSFSSSHSDITAKAKPIFPT